MMELLFEFSLNIIDYYCLLWFFLKLIDEKMTNKQMIIHVMIVSCIQFAKDTLLDFGGISVFIDTFIVVVFLFLSAKKKTFHSFISALLQESIFKFAIVFFVSMAIELSIDIDSTLVFGMSRFIFCVFLKLFVILILHIVSMPLKKLNNIMAHGTVNLLSSIIMLSLLGLSYVYGYADDEKSIIYFTLILTIILFLVYYMFYGYCKMAEKYANTQIINTVVDLTSQQIEAVENEHNNVRKIKHDMKNQLLTLCELQREHRYDEVSQILTSLSDDLTTENAVITGNIFIDAVLRQKIAQYSNVEFDLEITITDEFKMEGKDIISLVSNIIDNACEEIYRIDEHKFYLQIKANEAQIRIVQRNKCSNETSLKTNKRGENHGYGLKIIKGIVDQYEGEMNIKKDKEFTLKIMIPL